MPATTFINTPQGTGFTPNPDYSKSYAYSRNATIGGERQVTYGNILTMHGKESGLGYYLPGLGDFLAGFAGLGETTPVPRKPIIKPTAKTNIPDWFWIAGAVVGYLMLLPRR